MHKYYIIILGVQDDANIQNKDIIAFQTNREHHMLLPSFVENIFHGCLLISPRKMDGCDVDFSGQYYEIRRDIAMKGAHDPTFSPRFPGNKHRFARKKIGMRAAAT